MRSEKKDEERTSGVCPRCGESMPREPGRCALSRTDDETLVCSPCGEAEGLEWYAASHKAGHSVKLSRDGWKTKN
jgi:predicted RNA-binding Zn-ribbon protein involved in translation (DUF1610 family)